MRNRNKRRAKMLRQRSSRRKHVEYGQLEPRNLLASVEVGLNFTGTLGGIDVTSLQPDIAASVGPDHIIEMVNDRYTVFDKDGAVVESTSLSDFWTTTAAATTSGTTVDPRIHYDPFSQQWFAAAHGDEVNSQIYVAISNTSDPTEGWTSVQFFADSLGTDSIETLGFAIDANGVYVSTNNDGPVDDLSLFSIPKRDLVDGTPTLARLTRFEGLDTATYGSSIQVAIDQGISSRAFSLATVDSGESLIRTDIVGTSGPGAGLTGPITIDVPDYSPAPDARQPSGDTLQNDSPRFTSNTVRAAGSLWAVHSVASVDGSSAVRWYQINEQTNELTNFGTISDPIVDYTYPSIAVNEFGTIAIGMTASGPDLFPSSAAATGFVINGSSGNPTVEIGDVRILREGLGNYIEGMSSPWGDYSSTQVDPTDPFSFWTFQEYANTDNNWSTRITEVGLFDATPTVRADAGDNRIVVRSSPGNSDWIEIEIDGVVTDTLERRSLTSLNVDGQGGDDDIIVDLRFGDPIPLSGVTVRGNDGYDTLRVLGGSTGQEWNVNGDGAGIIDGSIRFFTFEELVGSDLDDTFNVNETGTDLVIRGENGNDFFNVTGPIEGNLELRGEDGDDTYRIPIETITTIVVIDDVGDGADVLAAYATDGDDVIVVNNDSITLNDVETDGFIFSGVESVRVQGIDGDDTFNIIATQTGMTFEGGAGNDFFNVGDPADTSSQLTGPLTLDGEGGNDRIVATAAGTTGVDVVVTSNAIMGIGSTDINYVSAGDVPLSDTEVGITLLGSDFAGDAFEVASLLDNVSLKIDGGRGDDLMTVRAAAAGDVHLDGAEGSDTYQIGMKNLTARTTRVQDTGENSLNVNRVNVAVTDGADAFAIRNSVLDILNETVIVDESVDVWVVNTLDGDDQITVAANAPNFLRVITGNGNDTVDTSDTNGMTGVRFDLGAGNDTALLFNAVNTTFVNVRGGEGDDMIVATDRFFANGRFDGENGSDVVNLETIGFTSRQINARDTGTTGSDKLNMIGSDLIDNVTVYKRRVTNRAEAVLYDGNTEQLFIDTAFLSDTVTVRGLTSPLTIIQTAQGDDQIRIESTSGAERLIINSGVGNDDFLVKSTTEGSSIFLRGNGGDDDFRFGSSFADSNGNLSQLRGSISVDGGASNVQDRIFVNDNGAMSNYDYFVSPSLITNFESANSTARDNFAGISHANIESVRLDGTDQANMFVVRPSTQIEYFINGNSPLVTEPGRGDFLNLLGSSEGRTFAKNAAGDGLYKFDDGRKEIRFLSIETDS